MKVLGFVSIQAVNGSYSHRAGSSIRCRWPGCAEEWLKALVEHGQYERYEAMPEVEYRGARVFRVFGAKGKEGPMDRLMAVWEGRF